jgi:FMN-dependent NADH-azoreductase
MIKILHIDSSIQGKKSVSKKYSKKVVEKIKEKYTNSQVEYLDIGEYPLKAIDGKWVNASYTPIESMTDEQKILLKESDKLIDQIESADIIVIGCPMYNFTISANLKIWIDLITRKWRTFDEKNQGMIFGKKIYIVMTRGGSNYEEGEKLNFLNGQELSIVAPLSFIGMKDVKLIKINKCSGDNNELIKNADKIIDELIIE